MTPEIAVGLIGAGGACVGALVGGIATFSGVAYQQKRQAEHAETQRLTAMGQQAADAILGELDQIRDLAWSRPDHEHDGDYPPDESAAWSPAVHEWHDRLREHRGKIPPALLRLPDEELRKNLQAICISDFGDEAWLSDATGAPQGKLLMLHVVAEAEQCLGAHLRGEPIPDTRFLRQARLALVELSGGFDIP